MKLSTFILDNIEQILQEWERFAKTMFPASQHTSVSELRDHAKQMLMVIVSDLGYKPINRAQIKKIKKANQKNITHDTPAEEYGAARLQQGFTINEIALEYQALRKSVITLFNKEIHQVPVSALDELLQFNELIDRSLSESIVFYSSIKEQQTCLFDTMLSSSPDFSYILDLKGCFLYINKAMADLYQQPMHEILGTGHYNIAMPTPVEVREHIHHVLETKTECHGEIYIKQNVNESEHFFLSTYIPLFLIIKK